MKMNLRKSMALLLVFIMVFSVVPVLADNSDDTNAANSPKILSLGDGGIWLNFSVNYEKSRARLSNQFYNVNEFNSSNSANWTEIYSDADGNYKKLVKDTYISEDSLFNFYITISDADNAQARYWRIWTENVNGKEMIKSEELNSDGTSKGGSGWRFDELSSVHNIQPVKKSQGVSISKNAVFSYRFHYSDPNVAQDAYALDTNLRVRVFYVNKGADPKVLGSRTYVTQGNLDGDGFSKLGTEALYYHNDKILAGKDYYIQYRINESLFIYEVEPGYDYITVKLFTAETSDKWVNGSWSYEVKRDALGNHINPYEFNSPKQKDQNTDTEEPDDSITKTGIRIAGDDRYKTAVEVSKAQYPDGKAKPDTIIIASGKKSTDALSAGPLAIMHKAPILLVTEDDMTNDVQSEIKRLGSGRFIVIGGENSVGPSVISKIETMGGKVTRLAGENRFETSIEVAKALKAGNSLEGIILANAYVDADALTISGYAAKNKLAIVLTGDKVLPAEVSEFLDAENIKFVEIVGGISSISKEVESELGEAFEGRIQGSNRYLTAIEIAKRTFKDTKSVIFVNAKSSADALAAAPYAYETGMPILLNPREVIEESNLSFLKDMKINKLTIIGGVNSIAEIVIKEFESNK